MMYLRNYLVFIFLFFNYSFALSPKNIIIMIGDGMGPEQVKAAGMYSTGAPGTLNFDWLPYKAECTTFSADDSVTDSAAAGTAIATGHKVNNDVVSIAQPGDERELQSLLEYFKDRGKSIGLVTTAYIASGTPAAFGAHKFDRGYYTNIINDYG
jgi:alkaline phosphatase